MSQASVGTVASLLVTVPAGPSSVVLTNTGAAPVAVGAGTGVAGSNLSGTVATAGGALIPAGGSVTLTAPSGAASAGSTPLYAIVASGTAPAAVGVFLVTGGGYTGR